MDAVILTGGLSRRMGTDKKDLTFHGETFLKHIIKTLRTFDHIWISTRDESGHGKIPDIYRDAGPLGGIHSGLVHAKSEEIFVISCDLPLIEESHIELLVEAFDRERPHILVPKTDRIHPLCGIYSREILQDLERALVARELKLQKFLTTQDTYYLPVSDERFQRALEYNINTPEEYRKLLGGSYERS